MHALQRSLCWSVMNFAIFFLLFFVFLFFLLVWRQSRYKAPPPDPVELVPVEGRNSLVSTSNPTFTPDEVEQSTVEVSDRTRPLLALRSQHSLACTCILPLLLYSILLPQLLCSGHLRGLTQGWCHQGDSWRRRAQTPDADDPTAVDISVACCVTRSLMAPLSEQL